MNNFENKYKKNLEHSTPDLWARIEASIDEKDNTTTSPVKFNTKRNIIKPLSMAACLLVVIGVGTGVFARNKSSDSCGSSAMDYASNNMVSSTVSSDNSSNKENSSDWIENDISSNGDTMVEIPGDVNVPLEHLEGEILELDLDENTKDKTPSSITVKVLTILSDSNSYVIVTTPLKSKREIIFISDLETGKVLEKDGEYTITYFVNSQGINQILTVGGSDE